MNAQTQINKLLKPQEVADMFGISKETLNTWRATQRYPLPYVKIGGRVRYKAEDIQNWLSLRTHNSLEEQ